MRLLDKLKQKRDFHLAQAGKFSDLIAVIEGDEDLAKAVRTQKLGIVNGAKQHFDTTNGAKRGPFKGRKQSAKMKKAASRRMKKLWKTKRATMIAGVQLGARNRQASRPTP